MFAYFFKKENKVPEPIISEIIDGSICEQDPDKCFTRFGDKYAEVKKGKRIRVYKTIYCKARHVMCSVSILFISAISICTNILSSKL